MKYTVWLHNQMFPLFPSSPYVFDLFIIKRLRIDPLGYPLSSAHWPKALVNIEGLVYINSYAVTQMSS